ncbi:hypothetical protein [Hydrogenophaga crocea]|uniref:Uncharacterized protein n=1 Tax=Hydrogenophaga crocea TaxID=2716225 RepID=A0A6G8IJ51_9BURK|nr:hypothetical protein [Hydrogenophaga crocea]QIM53139.1 hypothetical protein G9Q37_13770 [Hydrogenophaga crocea]
MPEFPNEQAGRSEQDANSITFAAVPGQHGSVPPAHEESALADATLAAASARFSPACQAGPGMFNSSLLGLLQGWVDGSYPSLGHQEEVSWFLSKRAHALISEWLMNKKLAALELVSPAGTGCVVISRSRVEHVRDSRTSKDSVADAGVVELLGQLFVYGHPKYAPNPGYPNQLLMFDATYKAGDPAAKGESPVAALRFEGAPMAHFRLETAYWMKPAKAQLLVNRALAKKK